MSLRRLYQKSLFLPLAIIFTYFCLFLEVVKYPTFFRNHFIVDAKTIFSITIVFLIFSDTKGKVMNLLLKANRIFLIAITLVYLTFSLIEGAHFTNYVLATYRFHLDGLILPVLFSLSIFLVEKFKEELPKVKGKLGIFYFIFVSLFVFYIVKNTAYAIDSGVSRNSYILFHLGKSYDDRMTYQWGIFYQFMVFVRNNTPADATIVIPPQQDPWLMGSGNHDFVRAFLFPRNIIEEPLMIRDIEAFDQNTYILITWGKEACKPDPECHGWPKQEIQATKIIYKDPNSSNVIETRENTVYNPEDKKYVYGVIEI